MAVNIVIFASGSGTNAENLFHHFKNLPEINVRAFFCNNPNAYVIERAKKLQVPCEIFDRQELNAPEFLGRLETYDTDFIVLAGFLWMVPGYLIDRFTDKIINIHPALLPKYGGKGMYGNFVHQAVINEKERVSGITIHVVNSRYDEGRIIFQEMCEVKEKDTPESLARRIHELEYKYFPEIVEDYIREYIQKTG